MRKLTFILLAVAAIVAGWSQVRVDRIKRYRAEPYFRVLYPVVYAQDYCKFDGTTYDGSGIQNAWEALVTTGGTLFGGNRWYILTNTIELPNSETEKPIWVYGFMLHCGYAPSKTVLIDLK